MFTVYYKGTYDVTTVYAVDFMHDAFLVYKNDEFKWVSMKKFDPVGDSFCP